MGFLCGPVSGDGIMHRFYLEEEFEVGQSISLKEDDTNHIKNVLRMKSGDHIVICNGQGKDYYCIIEEVSGKKVISTVLSCNESGTELKSKVVLFQGIPKQNKMDLIIQKAVELGVHEIVPVITNRVIVNLKDSKKEDKKIARWQSVAESAAKQSRRGVIPLVKPVMKFNDAIAYAKELELLVIPYEKSEGIGQTKEILNKVNLHKSVGVFIGPEGGFEEGEIKTAVEHNINPITLGKRILRTETASIVVLAMIMLELDD